MFVSLSWNNTERMGGMVIRAEAVGTKGDIRLQACNKSHTVPSVLLLDAR